MTAPKYYLKTCGKCLAITSISLMITYNYRSLATTFSYDPTKKYNLSFTYHAI